MKGLVLAAGKGEKMSPFGLTRPKAMIPVGNKPAIGHILEGFAGVGIRELVIVVGHLAQQVVGYVESVKERLGIRVRYVRQDEPRGTADALLSAKGLIEDDVLVSHGDVITTPGTYRDLVEEFYSSSPFAVAALAPLKDRPGFGVALDGKTIKSVSWWGEGEYKLRGVYVLSEEALEFVNRNPGIMRDSLIGIMPPQEAELAQSVSDMAKAGRAVRGVAVRDFIVDLDFPWDIISANMAYYEHMASKLSENTIGRGSYISEKADVRAPVVLGDNSYIGDRVVIKGKVFVGDNSRIDNGAVVEGGIIGNNTVLEDYCYVHAVVGNNVRIGHGAEVFGVVFDRVYIVHYSEVAGVVGENTDIGAATVVGTLRFDSEEQVVRVRGKRYRAMSVAFIGDYCRTGVNAIIMPGVRIGPYSVVGPGVILYRDLGPRKMILAKQEYVERDWGPERYGW